MKAIQLISKRQFSTKKFSLARDVLIVAAKRTAIGSFMGKLSKTKPVEIAAAPIVGAIESIELPKNKIDELILGNVISAGLGQYCAKQIGVAAGLPVNIPASIVNKACSSGMKSIIHGVQSIASGANNVVIVGGFESMSQAPFLLLNHRKGFTFGNESLIDSLAYDGLIDSFNNCAMGLCAEKTIMDFKIDRSVQDDYAIQSYERARQAIKSGKIIQEIVPVKINEKEMFSEDEEYLKFQKEKIQLLSPVYSKNGTLTPGNSSKFNDGACALISEDAARTLKLRPLARIKSFAEVDVQPIDFSIAPTKAVQQCLERVGEKIANVDFFEINETYASVALANMKLLDLEFEKVNVHGGAVSLGHPLGMSGARIVLSLLTVLKQYKGKKGVATIANGGGGSAAILIESLD